MEAEGEGGSEREDPAWSGLCGPRRINWMGLMGHIWKFGQLVIPMVFFFKFGPGLDKIIGEAAEDFC